MKRQDKNTKQQNTAKMAMTQNASDDRKGQIAVFIILAMVMLFVIIGLVAISVLQSKDSTKPPVQRAGSFEAVISDITTYIQACIAKDAEPTVYSIAKHGGRLDPSGNIYHNGTRLNALCINGNNKEGCVSTLTTKAGMEEEIKQAVMTKIADCLNIQPQFSSTGASITTGSAGLNVSITIDAVYLTLTYPINVKIGPNERDIDTFTTQVDAPLGRLFGTALDIANEIGKTGFFDKDQYTANHDTSILIEAHRPYPHTVYQLRRHDPRLGQDFLFQFAIGGTKTAGREPLYLAQKYGCCFANDNTCHMNAPQTECVRIGKYEPIGCGCPANAAPVVEGCCARPDNTCGVTTPDECASPNRFYENDLLCSQVPGCTSLDCPQTYSMASRTISAGPRRNGESWCVYEGRVGNGNDLVGSRHYVHSCVRGREYVEPCRDFREELCAEERRSTIGGATIAHAACRINRFADCTVQQDGGACLDSSVRDCEWMPNVYGSVPAYNRVKCIPAVAPGLPHYDGIGQGVCKEVSDDNPPKKRKRTWNHQVCWACLRAGDCGPKSNFMDVLTLGGFFTPDGSVEPGKLLPAGSTRQQYPGLPLIIGNQKISPGVLARPDIISNPSGGGSHATCSLWQVPGFGDCAECNKNPYWRPCTEYRCRSIGANCKWTEVAGIGTCAATSILPPGFGAPKVQITSSNPSTPKIGGNAETDTYHLIGAIKPHEPWRLTLESDQPVRCRITPVPKNWRAVRIDPWGGNCPVPGLPDLCFWLPTVYFSDGQLGKKHDMTIRFPSKDLLIEGIDPETVSKAGPLIDVMKSKLSAPIFLYIRCENEAGVESKELEINVPHASGTPKAAPNIIEIKPPEKEYLPGEATGGTTKQILLYTDRPFDECFVTPQDKAQLKLSCGATEEEDIQYGAFRPAGSYECAGSSLTLNAPRYTFQCINSEGQGLPSIYEPGRQSTSTPTI